MAKKRTRPSRPYAKPIKGEEKITMNCDPLVVFQDIRSLILEKYPNIKISELELALAWYIMDLDITVNNIAPEAQNVTMYETISNMITATQGNHNTIVRILSDIELLNTEIEKMKKKQQEKNGAS